MRKGFDPRDFALVAEGGAGPLFAAQIALEVGTPCVLVPPYPGVTAAMGLLATDMVYEYVATVVPAALEARPPTRCSARSRSSRSRRASSSRPTASPADRIVIQRVADCRYLGQGYELRVDAAFGADRPRLGREDRAPTSTTSTSASTRGASRSSDIEVPNVRVRGIGLMPPLETPEIEHGDESPEAALRSRGRAPGSASAASFARSRPATTSVTALRAGNRIEGPAIVNQYDSTTVIPPGIAAHVDRYGNIVIEVGASAEAKAIAAATRVSTV